MTSVNARAINSLAFSSPAFPLSLRPSQAEALRAELESLSDYERFEVEAIIEELAKRAEVAEIERQAAERAVSTNEDWLAKRERWRSDPVAYLEERLGLYVWGTFRTAIGAIRPGMKVAIESAKGVGKTEYAAGLVHWFLECFEQNELLTVAPKWSPLKKHLWPRIHKFIHKFSLYDLRLVNDMSIKLGAQGGRAYAQAIGESSDPEGMQGAHAPFLMQIVEEASGITELTADAIDGNDTGEQGIQVWIGNPKRASGAFHSRCHKDKSFQSFRISAFDHPNIIEGREIIPGAVSRKKIEQRAERQCERCAPGTLGAVHLFWLGENNGWYLPTSPEFKSDVLGEPPTQDENSLIPEHLVTAAMKRPKPSADGPIATGCDVARFGSDDTVIVDIAYNGVLSIARRHGRRTTETAGELIANNTVRARPIAVDDGGLGAGVSDTLHDNGVPHLEVNFANRAADGEGFANKKAELYWALKEELTHNRDFHLPNDEDLKEEIVAINYSYNGRGQVVIEGKEEYRKRTGKSPDTLEAVLLALYALQNGTVPEAAFDDEEDRFRLNEMPI